MEFSSRKGYTKFGIIAPEFLISQQIVVVGLFPKKGKVVHWCTTQRQELRKTLGYNRDRFFSIFLYERAGSVLVLVNHIISRRSGRHQGRIVIDFRTNILSQAVLMVLVCCVRDPSD